ncbi:prolyl-tRNA synthetase [Olsenella sp. KH1P3]|uniref:Proline--tRNA ligase n=2 Tax=Coriobacteriales TaxID=84999 RepID=A0A1H9NSL6_9ACTN|nr:prolyl-tRNA synthetase [Parafannyhessea umbonata]SER38960.1 prolyl-tRNA synthetase [Parafannyhessea umbonata]SJZ50358.1 prolyl-tRNA synthetase [Olsenella sp. KH1P3]
MKMSKLYAPTLKEDPTEAELASHRLLLRAGMIRRGAAGLYSYLPLAWRTISKIEAIIREEMEAIDAQEMLTPILTDAELWHQSGRWDAYGPELMRVSDRHDHEFALGPTHEETYTDLVRNELRSYKQLPVTLYHIQDKFRDELRPRFGLMRGREFIMKDAYSFSATQESLQECYDQEKDAYASIMERSGLKALQVVADSGQIGGDTSVEFMALADAGEADLVYCDDCGFAADTEAAVVGIHVEEGPGSELEKIETPCDGTIEAVSKLLDLPECACRKSVALVAEDGTLVLAIVPGDHEINDVKAEHLFGHYDLMSDDELEKCGLVKGFMGPVGANGLKVVADVSLKDSQSWLVGANEVGFHFKGAKPGRDFQVDEWADLASAKEGDACPKCGAKLKGARGIECGQVFQLGTKYSEAMGATFADEDGKEKPLIMGCYGIGVSRMVSAIVEQHHDEHGIIWPVSVAPYEVEVVPLDVNDDLVWPVAVKIASDLVAAGIEVVVDDRKERPGVKFNDADLYGFPYQIVCGKKAVKNGNVEVKDRATGERQELSIDEVVAMVVKQVESQRA